MIRLSEKEYFELYGDGGPYSEVTIHCEQRILDDKNARSFVFVQCMINPTTVKIIKKHKKQLQEKHPEAVSYAEKAYYMGPKIGYLLNIGYKLPVLKPEDRAINLGKAMEYKMEGEKVIKQMHKIVMEMIEI